MIAKVISIDSGAQYTDGKRRIGLKFSGSVGGTLRLSETELGIIGIQLDDEVEVEFVPAPAASVARAARVAATSTP